MLRVVWQIKSIQMGAEGGGGLGVVMDIQTQVELIMAIE